MAPKKSTRVYGKSKTLVTKNNNDFGLVAALEELTLTDPKATGELGNANGKGV